MLQKYGGISNYFINLIKQFNKKKNIISQICAPFYINEYLYNSKINNKFGIKAKFNIPFFFKFLNKLVFYLYVRYYKANIVHLTYYDDYILKKKNQKYILTVYDMINEEFYFEQKKEILKKKYNLCNNVDHIIAISRTTKKKIIEFFGIDKKKITVIYLGGDHMSNVKPLKIEIKRKFILYVGSRQGYKNFENLIKAYYLNNKIKKSYDLIVFGGEKILNNELNYYKKKFGDLNNLKFINSNDRMLKYLYKRAALLVYPSLQEGFGLPPLEAINNNCPVACSNIPVFKEILGNCCFYFNPKNIKEINYTIQKILYTKKKNTKFFKLSSEIKKKFTWQATALNTISVYKKILQT